MPRALQLAALAAILLAFALPVAGAGAGGRRGDDQDDEDGFAGEDDQDAFHDGSADDEKLDDEKLAAAEAAPRVEANPDYTSEASNPRDDVEVQVPSAPPPVLTTTVPVTQFGMYDFVTDDVPAVISDERQATREANTIEFKDRRKQKGARQETSQGRAIGVDDGGSGEEVDLNGVDDGDGDADNFGFLQVGQTRAPLEGDIAGAPGLASRAQGHTVANPAAVAVAAPQQPPELRDVPVRGAVTLKLVGVRKADAADAPDTNPSWMMPVLLQYRPKRPRVPMAFLQVGAAESTGGSEQGDPEGDASGQYGMYDLVNPKSFSILGRHSGFVKEGQIRAALANVVNHEAADDESSAGDDDDDGLASEQGEAASLGGF